MDVTVVIPHLNQPDLLHRLLTSLANQTYDMGAVQVVVVDNGSRELPIAVCDQFDNVTLLTEAEPGPGPARNTGAAHTDTPILAFIDSDCTAHSNWANAMVSRFIAEPDTYVLGGEVLIAVQDPDNMTSFEAYESLYAFRQQMYIRRDGYASTGNLAMRRSVFNAVGGFGGIGTAEDMDWGQRARAMGYNTVYAPDMVAYHPARASMSELRKKWSRLISHHFRDNAGTFPGRIKWILKSVGLPFSPLVEIPRILTTKKLKGLGSRVKAFWALVGIRSFRGAKMAQMIVSPSARTGNLQWNRD